VLNRHLAGSGLVDFIFLIKGTHWSAKQCRLISRHHRSSFGIISLSTVKPPGETIGKQRQLCPLWRHGDSRFVHGVSQRNADVAPTLAGRTTAWHVSTVSASKVTAEPRYAYGAGDILLNSIGS